VPTLERIREEEIGEAEKMSALWRDVSDSSGNGIVIH